MKAGSQRNTRVGFIWHGGGWMGGRTYLMNLFRAIRSVPDVRIEPILLKGETIPHPGPEFEGFEVLSTSLLDRRSPLWLAGRSLRALTGRDVLLERWLMRNGIEVLSHSGHMGRNPKVATIGWIPDFQYVHLPEFFPRKDRESRARWSTTLCKLCDRVVVSSETVRLDLCAQEPRYAEKAAILRFVSGVASVEESSSMDMLRQCHGIADRYFLVPNQFWAHKDHRLIVTALQLLKQQGHALHVYATGSTEDSRNPAFFTSLMKYAEECGVEDLFRPLGMVSFADLAGLMRNSVAMINPSRFEGWSTSVEESKSLGKTMILSDIPVHVEQAPPLGVYFSQGDARSLADAMLSVWQGYDQSVDAANQARAGQEFQWRRMEFGRTFEAIVSVVQHR